MIRHILFLAWLLCFVSCEKNKSDKEKLLLDSSGNINNVSVIVDNELWKGNVGEAIRSVLAKPVYGLPQDEPMFTLSQIPPAVFSGFVTRNRTVLKIEPNHEAGIEIVKDVYAKPQKVITISGKTRKDIINVLKENEEKIIETFKNQEIAERQRQMAKSPYRSKTIKEKLGLDIKFQSIYRIAKETDNFFWIRKDITTGTNNLMIYELPLDAFERNDSIVNQIIKIRDSIGKTYIEGPLEGSYMTTENAYTPFYTETILDNKPAFETRGLWDVKNAFMGGPFINYTVEDKINKRWVVVEGFTFAPSVDKRNYMLELEAIIRSLKID